MFNLEGASKIGSDVVLEHSIRLARPTPHALCARTALIPTLQELQHALPVSRGNTHIAWESAAVLIAPLAAYAASSQPFAMFHTTVQAYPFPSSAQAATTAALPPSLLRALSHSVVRKGLSGR